MVGGAGRGSW